MLGSGGIDDVDKILEVFAFMHFWNKRSSSASEYLKAKVMFGGRLNFLKLLTDGMVKLTFIFYLPSYSTHPVKK